MDKRGHLVNFGLNDAQERFVGTVDDKSWVYILKARQLGMTTVVAARFFWRALLTPNFKVCVLAHKYESAQAIFEIYRRFYNYLPDFLKFPTEKANVREMAFFHGGIVRVATANSDSARGTTYQALHCSEFAFWGDVDRTVASAFQTAGPDAEIVLETTANGLNDAHRMWNEESGFSKVFFPWMEDRQYVSSKKPKKPDNRIKELTEEFGLDDWQSNWANETLRTKCVNNWNTFLQEYPASAEQAFITSGEKFFDIVFPHAQAHSGYKCYRDPSRHRVYSMGVDTASGSPSGDFSSFAVIDVTDKKNVEVVSTYYQRLAPHAFAERVLEEAKKFECLVVVESNSYGLSILEYLVSKEFAYIFKRTQYDKMAERWVEKIGFNTNTSTRPVMLSRLHEYIAKQMLPINDERMKTEMNTFVYNDRGKAEAMSKKHDDMIFAHALALMGLDQIEYIAQDRQRAPELTNMRDILRYERETGRLYDGGTADYEKSRWGSPLEESSPLDAALNDSPSRR